MSPFVQFIANVVGYGILSFIALIYISAIVFAFIGTCKLFWCLFQKD